jgi:hypothetical protein
MNKLISELKWYAKEFLAWLDSFRVFGFIKLWWVAVAFAALALQRLCAIYLGW